VELDVYHSDILATPSLIFTVGQKA